MSTCERQADSSTWAWLQGETENGSDGSESPFSFLPPPSPSLPLARMCEGAKPMGGRAGTATPAPYEREEGKGREVAGTRRGRRRTADPRPNGEKEKGERGGKETGTAKRSVQQIGDQAVGVVGELAVIGGLAFLQDQEAGEGGDGVLLREDTVAVEEDRCSQRPAGEEGLDGGALLLEVDGHYLGARTPAAGERLDAFDDVARARRPGGPDDHDHGSLGELGVTEPLAGQADHVDLLGGGGAAAPGRGREQGGGEQPRGSQEPGERPPCSRRSRRPGSTAWWRGDRDGRGHWRQERWERLER